MQLIRGRHDLPGGLAPSVVSIGNFDGVHLGHLQLIKTLCGQADRYDLPPTVMTFDPHPHEYFSPQTAPPRLSSFREKLTYLEQAGIHNVVCIRFDQRFSQTSATDFIQEYLVKGLGARFVVVGDDFRFGLNREGDLTLLRTTGERAGFGVASVGTFVVDGHRVKVAGVVTHRQRPSTAGGTVFINLEDETGLVNVVVSRGCWARFQKMATGATGLVVKGRLERATDGEGVLNVVAERIEALGTEATVRSRDFR